MSVATEEKRQFKMHPKLLFDVIRRQAGTLSKAVLEGVMNAVDAKSTVCRISTTSTCVTVCDDGRGFRNRKEIENWFEVFGQPHEESEGKTYGTFRMGRGQMFAFGVNTWQTGKFVMSIDVQHKGLDYELQTRETQQAGCSIQIQLYNRLLPTDMADLERDLAAWVKWCPIPVYLNEVLLSADPATAKWDFVTDEAYIKLKPNGSLSIYNLGIHVLDMPGYTYGTGGEVVSRKQVKVNFARNAIQSDCPVWKEVKVLVDTSAASRTIGKKALTDDERQRIVDRLLSGQLAMSDAVELKLITAATGRQYPLTELYGRVDWPQLSNAPKGNRKADKLMRSGIALILADETLDRFHVKSVTKLLEKLSVLDDHSNRRWAFDKVIDFEELTRGLSDDYDLIEENKLTPNQQLWLRLIAQGIYRLNSIDKDARHRVIQVGNSESSNAWTDGSSYICINANYLNQHDFNVAGFVKIGRVLLHEMCHHSPNMTDHDHDQAFFEEFHDNADTIGDFAATLMTQLPVVCKQLSRKLTKTMLRDKNKEVQITEELSKFPHVGFRKL